MTECITPPDSDMLNFVLMLMIQLAYWKVRAELIEADPILPITDLACRFNIGRHNLPEST